MAEVWSSGDDPKSGLSSGFYPEGYNPQSPIYIPTVHPTPPRYIPKPPIYFPTPPIYDVPTTTSSKNTEDETPFYSTCRVSPAYCVSPAYYPCVSSDVPATTANNAQGPPPPSATTTLKAFEIQHAQAYESQQHNHQHGEGEEQLKKKPSSSGVPHSAVPPMPRGLGCVEEKQSAGERIPVLLNLTNEEGKIYDKIVCESDGFDCPYVRPEVMVPGLLKPYPLENISNVRRMELDYMADLALKHYNDLNGWSYRLVEVIKATRRYAGGWVYNITLRAKDDKSGSPPQNFQGRVYDSMGKYKVLFCRVEGNAEPTAIGDLDERPGCWVPKPLTFLPVGYSYSSSGHLMYGSSSDIPTTTANTTECSPPPTTTTTASTPALMMVSPGGPLKCNTRNM